MLVASLRTKIIVVIAVAITLPLVGYVDSVTGLAPDLTMLYMLPILAVVFAFGLWPGFGVALVAAIVETLGTPRLAGVPFPVVLVDVFLHLLVYALVIIGGDWLLRELRLVRRLQEQRMADIHLASEVQHGLAQGCETSRRDIQVASRLRFKREVGGDYFHFRDIGPQESFFCIADISGSGMTAALFTSLLDQAVREALNEFTDLDAFVTRLNARVHDVVPTNMFVTMACGVVGARRLSWLNAGHEPLFLWRSYDGRVETLLTDNAVPLGILDEFLGRQASSEFRANDVLLLVTDGVTESPRFIDDAFPRVAGVLSDLAGRGDGPREIVDGVYAETLTGQSDEIQDDIAVLAVRCGAARTASPQGK